MARNPAGKPWNGYKLVSKPNDYRCHICKRKNPDWLDTKQTEQTYVHQVCLFKESHYGMLPEQFSKWRSVYAKNRKLVLERDNNTCQMCLNKCNNCKSDFEETGEVKLNVHHIKSVKNGGSNDPHNLVTLCIFCNRIADSVQDKRKPSVTTYYANQHSDYINRLNNVIAELQPAIKIQNNDQ